MSSTPVVIRIEVTDGNSGAVIAALEKSFQQLGAAGTRAGKQVADGMAAGTAGMTAAAKAAAPGARPGMAGAVPPEIPIVRYSQQARQLGREGAAANEQVAQSAGAATVEMRGMVASTDAASLAMKELREQALTTRVTMAGMAKPAIAGAPVAAGMAGAVAPMAAAGAEGEAASATAYQRVAAATMELNYVQGRNREILAALRKGEVSAQQATLDLAESMNEQTIAARTLAEAKAALVTENTRLSGGSQYGESRMIMGAATGNMYQMEYGMARVLASSKLLAPLMESIFSVTMIGAGVAMVGMMADEVYDLYEKWTNVDQAVNKYAASAVTAAQQKLFDTASLETANSLLQQAHDRIEKLNQLKSAAGATGPHGMIHHLLTVESAAAERGMLQSGPISGKGIAPLPPSWTKQDDKKLATAHLQNDEAQQRVLEQNKQLDLERLQTQNVINEAGKRGADLINQKQKDGVALAERRYYWVQQEEKLLVQRSQDSRKMQIANGVPADHLAQLYAPAKTSDQAQEAADIARAKAEAENSRTQLARQHAEELAQIHEQALESGLHGEALYKQKMEYAIAELGRKQMATAQAVHDVKTRFANEELQRIRQEEQATVQMQHDAALAGMTGAGRTQAEGRFRVLDLQANRKLDPIYRAAQIAAARAQTNAEMLAGERSFARSMDAIADGQAEHQMHGFARIHADAVRQLSDLRRQFQEQTKNIDVYAPGGREAYGAYASSYQRGVSAIHQSEHSQKAELARQNAEETQRIEEEARIRSLSGFRRQTAQIEEQYRERTQRYRDELREKQISQDDFNRRVLAAQTTMNAQLAEQAKQARQKIAGELRGLMGPHPLVALEEMGQKYASEAGGALLQRAAQHFNTAENATHATLLDRIAGAPHLPGFGGFHAKGSTASGAGAMAIAQAEIHVAQGAIVLSGATGAGRGGFAGGSGAGTSTIAFGGGGFAGGAGTAGMGSGSGPTGISSGSGAGSGSGGVSMIPSVAAPVAGAGAMGVVGDVMHGAQAAKSIAGMMGMGRTGAQAGLHLTSMMPSGHLNADGSFTSAKAGAGKSMLGGGMTASNTVGAAGAGLGLFSAYKTGGMGGTLSGAVSGAKLGMEVGGPIGGAIGAIAGAAIGFFGGGEGARVWWLKQGLPRMHNDLDGYQHGSMDYLSATMDLLALDTDAKHTLKKMGMAGSRLYSGTVEGEIRGALSKLTREQKAGRSASTFSAGQFDQGGWTGNFGDMSTGPASGWAHMRANEFVVHEQPAAEHAGALEAIRAGASHAQMAAYYGGTQPRMSAAGGRGDTHLHVHALDAKSSVAWLRANKHAVRAALNESYAEYGGESDG